MHNSGIQLYMVAQQRWPGGVNSAWTLEAVQGGRFVRLLRTTRDRLGLSPLLSLLFELCSNSNLDKRMSIVHLQALP